jgi:hypothetical protein
VLKGKGESKLSFDASCEPGGTTMLDVLLIVVTIGFFAITLAYTAACGRL